MVAQLTLHSKPTKTFYWLTTTISNRLPKSCVVVAGEERAIELFNFQPGLDDNLLIHRNLARDASAEGIGAFGDHRQADLRKLFANIGLREDRGEFLREPVDDRLRRSSRRKRP
jgi:hypothetical protein